jgi:chromosome segregation ATPase
MSDQPLTRAVFEAFQRRLFDTLEARFAGVDARFEKIDVRFDEVAGQIDGLSHRLLHLDAECQFIKEALKRLEDGAEQARLELHRLDERLGRVEKRLDDLVAGEPRYALRADVQDLKARIDGLQARIDDLQKRADSA